MALLIELRNSWLFFFRSFVRSFVRLVRRSSGSSFVWFGRPGTAENCFGRYRAQKNFKPFFWFGRSRSDRPGTAENLGENLGFRRKSRTSGENLGFWRKSRISAKISGFGENLGLWRKSRTFSVQFR